MRVGVGVRDCGRGCGYRRWLRVARDNEWVVGGGG